MHATADAPTCPGDSFEREAVPHAKQLYRTALRLTQDHGHAEDLVQETLTRAYVKFDQFTPGTNLGGWLYRIMLSTFYTGCRQRRRRPAEVLAPEQDARHGRIVPARSAETEALGSMLSSLVASSERGRVVFNRTVPGYQAVEPTQDLLSVPREYLE